MEKRIKVPMTTLGTVITLDTVVRILPPPYDPDLSGLPGFSFIAVHLYMGLVGIQVSRLQKFIVAHYWS